MPQDVTSEAGAFLRGGGKIAEIIAAFDWSKTPLGSIESWPAPIKTTIGLILRSPIAIVTLWGEQGTMIYNDAYSEFAGARHPKLLGSAVREGWPEVADFNDNIMKVVLGKGETISYRDFELVLYRRGSPEPESVWFNLDYSPVLDEAGQPIGVIAIVVEITETHHANIRVRESEARFRALTNASASVIYRMNADWTEMRRLDGRSFLTDTQRPSVKWMDAYLFPEDQRFVTAAVQRAIAEKGVFELEHRVRQADGSVGWTYSRAIPVLDEKGEIIEWFGAASDVTARHDNEARLQFLDSLGKETARSTDADTILAVTTRMTGEYLGVANCAYADLDPDQDGFTIRGDWAAPGAMHIVGHYSLADFGKLAVKNLRAGLPLVINDNHKDIAPEEAAAFQAIGIGSTICMPLVKDNRLTALMAIHHTGPHMWTAHEMATIREVTERSWAHIERVRSELEVRAGERRFREELEKQVAERSAALVRAERALQQSQKMEAVGSLTGGIAHDFNNLLMAVQGNLELLRKRLSNDTGLLRLVDAALEGSRRGASLTSRMLAFARRQDLQVEPVDLGALVEGMAELMQRSLGPTISVDIRIDRDLSRVQTDANQLEAALLNLVVNARDAMNGEGPIVIAAREDSARRPSSLTPGRYICLSVTDQGGGMDEPTLKRATEPFFTTKGIGKGTGLGLSMVLGLAEQSGGTLSMKSTPGTGTTAEIWLPVATPAVAARHTAQIDAVPAGETKPLSILLVDDDALILMSTADMLEDLGHSVVTAQSGREALERLAGASFDLMITDHAMPHMTGAQLIRETRSRHPAMPVVVATGYAEMPAEGIVTLRLAKPYSQADLAQTVLKATTQL